MANILVIDDDQDILRLLEFTLRRGGHTVTTATDGAQGLDVVQTSPPDLVVADVMMPKMTGYEFCKQVRANPQMADLPIIIFSARFQAIDKKTAMAAGATDYMPKSTSSDALVQRIAELLPDKAASPAQESGYTIGFFSLRGGSGVTSLAVNAAVALALMKKKQIALIDMVPFGGHTTLMLGARPTSNIVEALSTAGTLSISTVKKYIIRHNSGVDLLASSLNFEHQFSTRNNKFDKLIAVLKPHYPFTIFDMSRFSLNAETANIWKNLDKVAIVLTPDMPSLQSVAMTLQGLAWLGIPPANIALILNQTIPQNALTLETIKKAVKRPITGIIPFEPEMLKAVNSGRPLMLQNPNTKGAAAIGQMANTLISTKK